MYLFEILSQTRYSFSKLQFLKIPSWLCLFGCDSLFATADFAPLTWRSQQKPSRKPRRATQRNQQRQSAAFKLRAFRLSQTQQTNVSASRDRHATGGRAGDADYSFDAPMSRPRPPSQHPPRSVQNVRLDAQNHRRADQGLPAFSHVSPARKLITRNQTFPFTGEDHSRQHQESRPANVRDLDRQGRRRCGQDAAAGKQGRLPGSAFPLRSTCFVLVADRSVLFHLFLQLPRTGRPETKVTILREASCVHQLTRFSGPGSKTQAEADKRRNP